jgi:hypothetical protein
MGGIPCINVLIDLHEALKEGNYTTNLDIFQVLLNSIIYCYFNVKQMLDPSDGFPRSISESRKLTAEYDIIRNIARLLTTCSKLPT